MDKVFDLVAGAINELNAEFDYDSFRNPTLETPIYSADSDLDSLHELALHRIHPITTTQERASGRRHLSPRP